MSTSSKHLLFIFLNSLDLVCRQTRLEFFSENLILLQRLVKINVYNIFPGDFKPIPVKVETTVSFPLFSFKYFFNPAIVAEEVGSIK
jgi:hypothetical protein